MIGGKPYYEVKYREFGKKDYSIGYSSYSLKTVLGFIDEYFEIVESKEQTNSDRIRNMSDEELAETIHSISCNATEITLSKRKFATELKQLVHQKCVEINHYVSGCNSTFSYLQIADVQESLRDIENTLNIKIKE